MKRQSFLVILFNAKTLNYPPSTHPRWKVENQCSGRKNFQFIVSTFLSAMLLYLSFVPPMKGSQCYWCLLSLLVCPLHLQTRVNLFTFNSSRGFSMHEIEIKYRLFNHFLSIVSQDETSNIWYSFCRATTSIPSYHPHHLKKLRIWKSIVRTHWQAKHSRFTLPLSANISKRKMRLTVQNRQRSADNYHPANALFRLRQWINVILWNQWNNFEFD